MSDDARNVSLVFARPDLPAIFTDGIMSASWGEGVVKFYLGRTDPEIHGNGPGKAVPAAQVVMPFEPFITGVVFLNSVVDKLIDAGTVDQAILEAAREFFRKREQQEEP